MIDTPRGLGCLIDDPLAIAARTDPRNHNMADLITADVPVPDSLDYDLGPVLDQDGIGACVAFAATSIRSHQEHIDEGAWAFDTDSAFTAYEWLKHGHGAYPGDYVQGEGSYPKAVWTLAKDEGIPGRDGKPRRIAAYYQLQGDPGSEAWVATRQQVLLQYGPVSVSSAWPGNWWSCGTSGFLPLPRGVAGGHMFVCKGFWLKGPVGSVADGRSPTGRYWRYRQSWGDAYARKDQYGRGGEFLLPFESDTSYPVFGTGGECWKTIDIKGDGPVTYRAAVRVGFWWAYTRVDSTWTRTRRRTGGFSATCTTPASLRVMGAMRVMSRLTNGAYAGLWVDSGASGITIKEIG
jgi:hypothetical protein